MIFTVTRTLLLAAVIPAVILLIYIYKKDKLDKEPPGLLLSLIFFGIIATSLAKVTEQAGIYILSFFAEENSRLYNIILYFVIVALSEEGFKYLLLKIRTWRSPSFNCQFDAVVYAVFVSLGFALWENIGYVFAYGMKTALVRAVTAVPGHACFGVFMGVWYGLAKRYDGYGNFALSKLCRILSLSLACFMHGCYDYIATLQTTGFSYMFLGFVFAMFAVAFILVKRMSAHDRYIGDNNVYYE